jgi:hypothetical protein
MKQIVYLLFLLSPVLALIAQQCEENVNVKSHCKWCYYITTFLAYYNNCSPARVVNETKYSKLSARVQGWIVAIDQARGEVPSGVEFSATSRSPDAIDLFYFHGTGEGAPLTQAC